MIAAGIALVSVVIAWIALVRATKSDKQSSETQERQTEVYERIADIQERQADIQDRVANLHEKQTQLTGRVAEHQVRSLEAAEEARQRAEVTVEMDVDDDIIPGRKKHKFVVKNAPGGTAATHVNLQFLPREGQKHSPLVASSDELPIPILQPGQDYPIPAGISGDCRPPFVFDLTWMDESCNPGNPRKTRVHLSPH